MRSRTTRSTALMVGVSVLATTALAGCAASNSSAEGADTEPVTLNYAIWDQNQEPALREAADAFTEANPNVTVEITVVAGGDYMTKLQTELTAGTGPDVFWMNGPNLQLYASNGQLAALDDTGLDESDYPASLIDLYTFDGKLYGAPKDFDSIAVFYNKALFDKAGLDYPAEGWTWADFQEAALKISDPANGVYGTASYPYGQMAYYNTILAAGGEIISEDKKTSGFDSPEAAEGVQFWVDLIENGSSPTLQQVTDTWPGDTFTSGKMGMFADGSWAAGAYSKAEAIKDVIGVAPLPVGPAGENTSVIHGLGNVANAHSKNLEWAKKLAVFMSGEEVAKIQAKTATVIPAFNGTQQDWIDALPTIDAQVFLDAVEDGAPLPISKDSAAWGAVEAEQIKKIYAGEVDTETGLKTLADEMNQLLAKE